MPVEHRTRLFNRGTAARPPRQACDQNRPAGPPKCKACLVAGDRSSRAASSAAVSARSPEAAKAPAASIANEAGTGSARQDAKVIANSAAVP